MRVVIFSTSIVGVYAVRTAVLPIAGDSVEMQTFSKNVESSSDDDFCEGRRHGGMFGWYQRQRDGGIESREELENFFKLIESQKNSLEVQIAAFDNPSLENQSCDELAQQETDVTRAIQNVEGAMNIFLSSKAKYSSDYRGRVENLIEWCRGRILQMDIILGYIQQAQDKQNIQTMLNTMHTINQEMNQIDLQIFLFDYTNGNVRFHNPNYQHLPELQIQITHAMLAIQENMQKVASITNGTPRSKSEVGKLIQWGEARVSEMQGILKMIDMILNCEDLEQISNDMQSSAEVDIEKEYSQAKYIFDYMKGRQIQERDFWSRREKEFYGQLLDRAAIALEACEHAYRNKCGRTAHF